MRKRILLTAFAATFLIGTATPQCPAGQSEVHIEVVTDDYGYETYWELLPSGSPCGSGTIFSGGNPTVGCSGAGDQQQINTQGYGNNQQIMEGPFCLVDGEQYDIYWADDWGDGGGTFNVLLEGSMIMQFHGEGVSDVFTFTVEQLPLRDLTVAELRVPHFTYPNRPVVITGDLRSQGSETISSLDLNYTINGGAAQVMNITGISIQAWDSYEFHHELEWTPDQPGVYEVVAWATNLNGQADLVPGNDAGTISSRVLDAIPVMVDDYLFGTPQIDIVADDDNDILVPRDLDFHPDPDRNELWILNKDVESSGGSTVRLFGPGEEDMTWQWQRDANAWHFMSLPTAISFADNGNFSTSPGVFDANHNGGTPFTGPSLWSADPTIYAQPGFGPLGSHIDMVHANPNSQGITHDTWNRFWLVDGHNGDITMNDFRSDHGPGMDDHNDAIIRRYADFGITKDPNDHIVSHTVLDKSTGWLYVVDHGGQRVLRMDINTGTVQGPATVAFPMYENYDEYTMVSGYTWEEIISEGLVEPAGIEVIGDRLLVSDHATGEIVVYDIANEAVPELGRIATGSPGIMGIKVGPNGHIWYVNATLHQVGHVIPDEFVGIAEDHAESTFAVHPVPSSSTIVLGPSAGLNDGQQVEILDVLGRNIGTVKAGDLHRGLDISTLSNGSYALRTVQDGSMRTARFVVQH